MKMKQTKILTVGGPCSCSPERTVRWAIPAVPGIPFGEVSCRGPEIGPNTKEHDLASGFEVARHVPDVGTQQRGAR